MSLSFKYLYKFGEFVLDTEEQALLSENGRTSLTPRVFEVLVFLVENGGKLLTKDEILENVWKDSFVEEGNLTFTINQLRKILNDDARQPRFIETVPRRGYRFIANIEKIQADLPPNQSEKQPTRFFTPKRLVFVATAVLLISTLVIASFWSKSSASKSFLDKPFNLQKITTSGNAGSSAISPNGKFVVHSVKKNEKESLWRQQIETGENTEIIPPLSTEYAEIYISKDSETLLFARKAVDNPEQMDIYRASIFGGFSVKIINNTEGVFGISPDEKFISFVRCPRGNDENCSLYIADSDGKNERKLITKEKPFVITDNEFSPSENSIVFAHGQSFDGSKGFSLSKLNLATNEVADISKDDFFRIQRLKILPSENKYLATGRQEPFGYSKIWLIDQSGNIEPITKDSNNYLSLSIDEKGEKLLTTQVRGNFNLYVSEIAKPNISKPLTEATEGLSFLPNGKIIYAANQSDKQNLWEIETDGSEQRQITNSPRNLSPLVSRDGKFIFFASTSNGVTRLWRINADGSNQIQIAKNQGGLPLGFSPDGKFVYYRSWLKSNIWQVSIDGGEESLVFDKTSNYNAISPDGKELARIENEASKSYLRIYSTQTRQLEKGFQLASAITDSGEITWSPNGEFLFYVQIEERLFSIWKQNLSGEKAVKLADLGMNSTMGLAISPNNKNFGIIHGNWDRDTVYFDGFK